jgi:hypothetical protein
MAEQQGSSSKAGEPSAANVFSGERSKEGYALTNAELFKLVDKVVYPGHADGEEVKGKPSEADRFAKAVCGTPASSGYTRVSTMRTKTNVKREYDSLQEYQCATCKRNLAANLALRPPTEKMRVYIPGPDIPQSSSQKFKCEAVFTDSHAEELEQAGYAPRGRMQFSRIYKVQKVIHTRRLLLRLSFTLLSKLRQACRRHLLCLIDGSLKILCFDLPPLLALFIEFTPLALPHVHISLHWHYS